MSRATRKLRMRLRPQAAPGAAETPRRRMVLLAAPLLLLIVGGAAGGAWYLFFAGGEPEAEGAPVLNSPEPPGPAPEGMVWVRGGEFYRGEEEFPDSQPVRKIYVDGFWMDRTEVTNAQFAKFVAETKYVTVAEQRPDVTNVRRGPDDPPLSEKPFSAVFFPVGRPDPEVPTHLPWWQAVDGADWRHPEGPESDLKGREDHPVVHVCWHDAVAYCKWRGKELGGTVRLPTEAEWEFAARGGLDRKPFVWGDEETPGDSFMANYWQGRFADYNTGEDGFKRTAPVKSFPPNGYGLYDMAGNVWEVCSDYYQADYYKDSPARNPKGPASSFDPLWPGERKHVMRGGSFLCGNSFCRKYVPGGRHSTEHNTGTSHIGFRCVMSPRNSKQ